MKWVIFPTLKLTLCLFSTISRRATIHRLLRLVWAQGSVTDECRRAEDNGGQHFPPPSAAQRWAKIRTFAWLFYLKVSDNLSIITLLIMARQPFTKHSEEQLLLQSCSNDQITREEALRAFLPTFLIKKKKKMLNIFPWVDSYRNISEICTYTESVPGKSMEKITKILCPWTVRACTWNKVIYKGYIEVMPRQTRLVGLILKMYPGCACRHTTKVKFI